MDFEKQSIPSFGYQNLNNHRSNKICSIVEVKAIIISMINDQREHTFANFSNVYLKFRKPVIEWMLDVCGFFKLHVTTAHAAICYLDRMQPTDKLSRHEWQMIAISCILIASKYNESDEDVPPLATLEEIIQHGILNETMLKYELWALKGMSWLLNARTPSAFLCAYCSAGVISPADILPANASIMMIEEIMVSEAGRLSTLCILETMYKGYLASDIAGALLYILRSNIGIKPVWNQELTELTRCNPLIPMIQDVMQHMMNNCLFDSMATLSSRMTDTLSSSGLGAGAASGGSGGRENRDTPPCTPPRVVHEVMVSPVSSNLFMQTMNINSNHNNSSSNNDNNGSNNGNDNNNNNNNNNNDNTYNDNNNFNNGNNNNNNNSSNNTETDKENHTITSSTSSSSSLITATGESMLVNILVPLVPLPSVVVSEKRRTSPVSVVAGISQLDQQLSSSSSSSSSSNNSTAASMMR